MALWIWPLLPILKQLGGLRTSSRIEMGPEPPRPAVRSQEREESSCTAPGNESGNAYFQTRSPFSHQSECHHLSPGLTNPGRVRIVGGW
ncbi:hypothetical protein F4780DRAFT_721490 [Xylariomycetidae sp. FL0641]|nr:hypothetical protein F4780DRAFT_721490 [Xylariomycetidae sp. FL0641]